MSSSAFQLSSLGKAIQVDRSQPAYLQVAEGPGLVWNATNIDASQFQLCTTYESGQYCLDIVNDDAFANPSRTKPCLAKPDSVTGQTWTKAALSDGSFRLSNAFSGPGWYLDVETSTNHVFMNNASSAGTSWKTDTAGVITSTSSKTSTSSSIATTTTRSSTISPNSITADASTTTSLITRVSSSTSESNSQFGYATGASTADSRGSLSASDSSGSLSVGAKAGIGIGTTLAALILFVLCFALWSLRRRRRKSSEARPMWVDEKQEPSDTPSINAVSYHRTAISVDPVRCEMDGQSNLLIELAGNKTPVRTQVSELPAA